MKERDIQNYLYTHPEVLFPTGNITEKYREYSIQGKRIDLLFVVDEIRYIVEIKNVPIQREHIGQIIEYYGLMRNYMKNANLSMILISPSIPSWWADSLEELGIRCFKIPTVPTTDNEKENIQKTSKDYQMKAKRKFEIESILGNGESISFEDIACSVTQKSMAFAWRMLDETLKPIAELYKEYEIERLKIDRPQSNNFDLECYPDRKYGANEFTRGGAWWGYRFGFSKDMDKNDIPNVSVIAYPTGLDVTVNAELQKSQKVLRSKIQKSTTQFDNLLADHGRLWLKTYLKFEHQQNHFHWILADYMSPGEFDAESILKLRERHEKNFGEERDRWIPYILTKNKEQLTEKTYSRLAAYVKNKTPKPNLATRLVEPFDKNAAFWSLS